MSSYSSTRAVVLRHEQHRSPDVRIIFLSSAHGKLDAVARGLHLHKSKLAASLEPFTVTEASFAQGRLRRLVTGSIPERLHAYIRKDPVRAFAAGLITRLADLMVPMEQPDAASFELTVEALAALDRSTLAPQGAALLPYAYVWKLLGCVGYKPNFTTCRVCEQPFGAALLLLDARGGGIVHKDCAIADWAGMPIQRSTIRALLFLIAAPLTSAVRMRLTAALLASIQAVTVRFVEERYDVPANGPFWLTLTPK